MNVSYIRGSSVNTYDDCQFKYGLIYDCGLPSKAGLAASKGTLCHAALERIANYTKDKLPHPPIEQIIKECWDEQTALEPWHNWTDVDYRFCQKQVYNVLNSSYDPRKFDIIDTEVQFEVVVAKPPFNGNLTLRGTIDQLYYIDDETLGCLDFKTGQVKNWGDSSEKVLSDYDEDNQFSTYDLVMTNLFPQYKNRIFTVLFTQKMQPFTFAYSKKHQEAAWERLRRYFFEIGSNDNPIRLKDDPLRTGEKFKCINVCSFGRDQRCIYQNIDTGQTVEHVLDKKHVESVIEDDDQIWELQYQESMCDYLHNKRVGKAFSESKDLIQLSVNGKYDVAVSKRNDYSNPKILRGVIK